MKRKTITIISVVIVLAISLTVFFYPKKCGNWGTSLEATYEKCDCIGLKLQEYTLGGGYYYCYGICLQNTCKPYKFTSQGAGAVPLNGWLFTVETDTEQKLYFVANLWNETDHSFFKKVLTENQVKEITNLTDIHPIKETRLTATEVKTIVKDSIASIASFDSNFRFTKCFEGCERSKKICNVSWPESCTKWCDYWSKLLPKTHEECEIECNKTTKEQVPECKPETGVQCILPPKVINHEQCVENCVNYSITDSKNKRCISSFTIGDPSLINYLSDRKPGSWYVPLYINTTYYGFRTVSDRCSFIETGYDLCDYFVSMYGQEEIQRKVQIPSDIEARNILLTYMKENNIKGTISESFLFQYLVQNFDALRAASK